MTEQYDKRLDILSQCKYGCDYQWVTPTKSREEIGRYLVDLDTLEKERSLTEDELGFFIYCFMGGYDINGEIAHEQWTGKHYQSKLKTDSDRLAKAILAKMESKRRIVTATIIPTKPYKYD